MGIVAPHTEKRRELDADVRRAWQGYRERTRELTGTEYELAESQSWEQLQRELRSVERRRRVLDRPQAPQR